MRPDKISTIFSKGAMFCGDRECKVSYVDESVGQCSSYGDEKVEKDSKDIEVDTKIWKFKDDVSAAVGKTLDELKSMKSS